MRNLGIPWNATTSLAGFPCATGARGSGRIPSRMAAWKDGGDVPKTHAHVGPAKTRTAAGQDTVLPRYQKHLGKFPKSHRALLKRAEQRKPASY